MKGKKKYLILVFVFFMVICSAQEKIIYQEEFIKNHIAKMNKKGSIIPIKYTPKFKLVLKELVKIGWMEKAVKITDYYFPLFEKKMKKYGLPDDLKYLPILESGLNPRAKSEVGAKGLWQFMESTGDLMGLSYNDYVDLYYCPVASTDSGLRYLKKLYEMYGDWKYVLSAYNYGFGNINKKIKQAKSEKYNDELI